MIKKNGIFSEVRFMNESAGGLIAMIAITLGLINTDKIVLLASKIPTKDQRMLKKAFTQYAKEHKVVDAFNKKMSTIKRISIDGLQSKIKMSDKDANTCKYNPVRTVAIFSSNKDIMAYAIFGIDKDDGYAYTICDKSFGGSKELNTFVKATFENYMKGYGPGLKELLKDKPLNSHNKYHYADINNEDAGKISEEEFSDILDQMKKIFTPICNALSSIHKKHSKDFELSIYFTQDIINKFKNDFKSGKSVQPNFSVDFEYDYNEIGDLSFDVERECSDIIIKKMSQFGFEPDDSQFKDWTSIRNDKYPYLDIYFYSYGSENRFGVTLYVRKKLHRT